jgi:hypothetical protein
MWGARIRKDFGPVVRQTTKRNEFVVCFADSLIKKQKVTNLIRLKKGLLNYIYI